MRIIFVGTSSVVLPGRFGDFFEGNGDGSSLAGTPDGNQHKIINPKGCAGSWRVLQCIPKQ